MQARRQATAVESLRGQLEALPATAFNILSERDQAILRAFCGMDRMEATTTRRTEVLATEFGLTKMSINRIVRRAASRILGDARQARSLARPTGPAMGDKRRMAEERPIPSRWHHAAVPGLAKRPVQNRL
jgi:hypothetical protein